MEADPPRSSSIGGADGRISGTRVKMAKRAGEGSVNCGGKEVVRKSCELSSSACNWGPGEKSARTPASKCGEVHPGGGGAGAKVGLARVGLFESAAAVGRVGPAYIATGKGGAAVGGGAARGPASEAGTGGTWASLEGKSVGSGKGAKGRARSSETTPGGDEGYYAHSYGQLAIHREMLQVQVLWLTTNDTTSRMM